MVRLARASSAGDERPTTAPDVTTFLTEVDELDEADVDAFRPDTAPHPRAGAPSVPEELVPPDVDVGDPDARTAEVAQQLFPALPPATGVDGRVGLLKLQGAFQAVRDKRRKKRQDVRNQIHSTIANLTVNQHLARNGLLAHPSLRSHLPMPPEDGWESLRPLHGPNRKVPIKPSPERVLAAADKFDERHKQRVTLAQRAYGLTIREPSSPRAEGAFERNMVVLRRNRFVVREALQGVTTYTRREKAKSLWKLETSIWAPRKKYCDAKDFYDSDAVRRRMFEHDWGLALNAHQLEKFITSNTLDGLRDADGDGVKDEVAEVAHVLWDHHQVIYATFAYYASLGTSEDIFHIYLNGFGQVLYTSGTPTSARAALLAPRLVPPRPNPMQQTHKLTAWLAWAGFVYLRVPSCTFPRNRSAHGRVAIAADRRPQAGGAKVEAVPKEGPGPALCARQRQERARRRQGRRQVQQGKGAQPAGVLPGHCAGRHHEVRERT